MKKFLLLLIVVSQIIYTGNDQSVPASLYCKECNKLIKKNNIDVKTKGAMHRYCYLKRYAKPLPLNINPHEYDSVQYAKALKEHNYEIKLSIYKFFCIVVIISMGGKLIYEMVNR